MNDTENQPVGTPADPFPTFAALRARHSELLDLDAETDGDETYLADVQSFFDRVRATGAVLSAGEERRATQSILNYWATVLYRADRKPSSTTLVDLDPAFKPTLDDARCPYPGVREFDETEGKYFFGRQRTIDYLLARLKEESFLALVGPSGSGKSSLVRAGLLPAIKNVGLGEDPDEIQRYFFPVLTPGSNPVRNLASLLSAADTQPEAPTEDYYVEKLRQDPQYFLNFLTEKIAKPSVIVVDQFEELFHLCKDGEERRAFILNLQSLDNSQHRLIVCSITEDFHDDLERLPEFEKVFERGRTLLPRLGTSELSDAIIKPADLIGFKFKDKTIKDIVQEIGTLPVTLPLLQFTLVKLWEKRGEHDEYFASIGGCRQLLTHSAEEFLSSLEPRERELAEQIFRKMVKFEYKYGARLLPVQLEARSAPVRLQDLRSELGTADEVDAMVDRMNKAQLIRRSLSATPDDAQLELVHDSLVQTWPRMARWVEWDKDRRFRVKSTSAAALVILIVVVLAVGGKKAVELIGTYTSREQASRLGRASRNNLNDKRLDIAMLLGLTGYLADPAREFGTVERFFFSSKNDLQTGGPLLSNLLFQPAPKKFLEHKGKGDVAFSPNNLLLAANDNQGNIEIWDIAQQKSVCTGGNAIKDPIVQGGDINPLIFTNDGQSIISGGAEEQGDQVQGAVSFWNVASCRQDRKFVAPDIGRISALALSRNDRLAALGEGGDVVVWDIAGGSILALIRPAEEIITSIALSNSGETLATGDSDGNINLWDVKRGRLIRPLGVCNCLKERGETPNSIANVAFSPDDKKLAVSGTEETLLWSDLPQDTPKRLVASRGGVGMILTFSADGKRLAGFEGSNQVYLWDLAEDSPKRLGENLFQSIMPVSSLAFSRDVNTLATLSEQGITLWDLSGQQPLDQQPLDEQTLDQQSQINSFAFTDNQTLVTGDENGGILLRDATTGKAKGPLTFNEQQSSIVSMVYSHQLGYIASALYRGGIVLWNAQGQQVSSVGPEVLDQQRSDQRDPETSLKVRALAFRGDNKILVSIARREGSGDLQLDAWNVPEMNRAHGKWPFAIQLNGRLPTAVAFDPNASMLAVAFDSQQIEIWDLSILEAPIKKEELPDLKGTIQTRIIQTMEFSPDGHWLAFGCTNSDSVYRYEISTRQIPSFIKRLRQKIFREQNPAPIFLEGLSGDIVDLSFTSDNRILAVAVTPTRGIGSQGDQPGAVVLVDIAEPRVMTEPIRGHDSEITTLSFRPDSRVLSTGSKNGSVLLWNFDLSDAKQKVCSIVKRKFTPEEKQQYSIPDDYLNLCGGG